MVDGGPLAPNRIRVRSWDEEWTVTSDIPVRMTVSLPKAELQRITEDMQFFYDSQADYTRLEVPYTRTYMLHGTSS